MSKIIDALCAAFCGFVKLLGIVIAAILVGWLLLGWLAAKLMWGSPGGGAALSLWLALILVCVWMCVRGPFEYKLDQLDQRIAVRARAWKSR